MIVIVGDSLDDVNCSPRPWFQAAEDGGGCFRWISFLWLGCPSSCYRFVVYGKPNVVCPSFQVVCRRQLHIYIYFKANYVCSYYFMICLTRPNLFDETLSASRRPIYNTEIKVIGLVERSKFRSLWNFWCIRKLHMKNDRGHIKQMVNGWFGARWFLDSKAYRWIRISFDIPRKTN